MDIEARWFWNIKEYVIPEPVITTTYTEQETYGKGTK
jgi:hypothetical protein